MSSEARSVAPACVARQVRGGRALSIVIAAVVVSSIACHRSERRVRDASAARDDAESVPVRQEEARRTFGELEPVSRRLREEVLTLSSQEFVDERELTIELRQLWDVVAIATATYWTANPIGSAVEFERTVGELAFGTTVGADGAATASSPSARLAVRGLPIGVLHKADAWTVVASFSHFSTFFVVAREGAGDFRVAWKAWKRDAENDSACPTLVDWDQVSRSWGRGPLVGRVFALPADRHGNGRFFVNAVAATTGGGTVPSHLSVWEWDGARARCRLAGRYSASIRGESVPTFEGAELAFPTKESLATFAGCGMCREPAGTWRVGITADGIVDRGHALAEPELAMIDQLFVRVLKGESASDLASSSVIAAVRGDLDERVRGGAQEHGMFLGMIRCFAVERSSQRSKVRLALDDGPGPYEFDVEQHGVQGFLRSIRRIDDPCVTD